MRGRAAGIMAKLDLEAPRKAAQSPWGPGSTCQIEPSKTGSASLMAPPPCDVLVGIQRGAR